MKFRHISFRSLVQKNVLKTFVERLLVGSVAAVVLRTSRRARGTASKLLHRSLLPFSTCTSRLQYFIIRVPIVKIRMVRPHTKGYGMNINNLKIVLYSSPEISRGHWTFLHF